MLAESESLSVWDVNSLEARRLHNVNLVGKKLRALHVQNDDAECSGGVRQRYVLHDCKMRVKTIFFCCSQNADHLNQRKSILRKSI